MKKIIHVEDDADTADAVKTILEIAGYHVDCALCGKDGLTKIKKNKYDLALLDVMLPDMTGWDIFEEIKTKKMKFAFLSSLPISANQLKQFKKSGVADYITKPFTKKDLTMRVDKILSSTI